VGTLVKAEVAAARDTRLGLLVGLNATDGGNGSSGIRGTLAGYWAMSAAELRKYGNVLLDQSYACAFYMWHHNTTYYGRSDIATAMGELSGRAKIHDKTSCRQY
jgi:hypothetical protein